MSRRASKVAYLGLVILLAGCGGGGQLLGDGGTDRPKTDGKRDTTGTAGAGMDATNSGDHSIYAMWLGSPVPLKLDTLRRNYRPELLPSA